MRKSVLTSIASMTLPMTCGLVSKQLGQTRLSKWVRASSWP